MHVYKIRRLSDGAWLTDNGFDPNEHAARPYRTLTGATRAVAELIERRKFAVKMAAKNFKHYLDIHPAHGILEIIQYNLYPGSVVKTMEVN